MPTPSSDFTDELTGDITDKRPSGINAEVREEETEELLSTEELMFSFVFRGAI